jgi:xylan 1,4-beta-xylosidase
MNDHGVRPPTFCNPIDLDYRFSARPVSHRSAADPTIVVFDNAYWLFITNGGNGYWRSPDLVHWTYVEARGLPRRDTAPTVEVIGGRICWTAFDTQEVYATDDPGAGVWTKIADLADFADPDLFLDDDGRLYMYDGCSHGGPIMGVELDPQTFAVIGDRVECFRPDIERRGWEVNGEDNRGAPVDGGLDLIPWVEAPWMTKHGGKYYLQYSAPGTEYKSYADGVFVADKPLGPFIYAPYSPFSHKPTGFIGGAGHGNTFQALDGSYWRIVTMPISVHEKFERRLGLFPVGFEPDGQMVCNTYLGDYPMYAPGVAPDPAHDNSPGWMLLSHDKPAKASSFLDDFPMDNAFDEDIRTWWSAKTGDPGEWLHVNLCKRCRIDAIQVNFADQGATASGRLGDGYRYVVEASDDAHSWRTVIDRRDTGRDAPHEYVQLDEPIIARCIRITNVHMPGGALFSLSGLRIFGNGLVWMTPSFYSPVTASSTVDGFPAENAVEFIVDSRWVAKSGDPGEWLQVDLGEPYRIERVNIRFTGLDNTTQVSQEDSRRYVVEASKDLKEWHEIVNRRDIGCAAPHDRVELDAPTVARYVRIVNVHSPDGAPFTVSSLLISGNNPDAPPALVHGVAVHRDPDDPRRATITWQPSDNADGYIVRYGIAPDRLFHNFQVYCVYGEERLEINCLNAGVDYWFTVDAFNESGVTKGQEAIPAGQASL